MNSTGVLRAYMNKSKTREEMLVVAIDIIEKEFNMALDIERINDSFIIGNQDSIIKISKEELATEISPYSIDKFILEKLEEQGFTIDKNRSQYIKQVFEF